MSSKLRELAKRKYGGKGMEGMKVNTHTPDAPPAPPPIKAVIVIGFGEDGQLTFQSKVDPATTFLLVSKATKLIMEGIEVGSKSKLIEVADGSIASKLRI